MDLEDKWREAYRGFEVWRKVFKDCDIKIYSHDEVKVKAHEGVICELCGEYNSYMERIKGFRCWSCRNGY